MKKAIIILLALLLTASVAFAENPFEKLSEDAQVGYNDEVALYVNSCQTMDELLRKETLSEDESAMLEELNLNYLLAHDCPGFGYTCQDLDGNGTPELIIAVMPTDDEFFGKLVLTVCTIAEDDLCSTVFTSGERNRYYWLGNDTFANIGSNGANDSIDTTLRYKDGKLEDLGVAADPASYGQFVLTAVYPVAE